MRVRSEDVRTEGGGRRLLVVVLAVALLVTGCTASGVERGTTTPGTPTVAPGPPGSNGADVDAARVAAGIEDCPATEAATAPVTDGLPALTLPCLGGAAEVDLSRLRGRPVMVNVWASWCPPCRAEAPYLAEVAGQTEDELLTLGLLYEENDKRAAIDLASGTGQRYAQLVDDERAIQVPLRVLGPPVTFFVTADGRLVHTHVGPFTDAAQIRGLLAAHLGVTA